MTDLWSWCRQWEKVLGYQRERLSLVGRTCHLTMSSSSTAKFLSIECETLWSAAGRQASFPCSFKPVQCCCCLCCCNLTMNLCVLAAARTRWVASDPSLQPWTDGCCSSRIGYPASLKSAIKEQPGKATGIERARCLVLWIVLVSCKFNYEVELFINLLGTPLEPSTTPGAGPWTSHWDPLMLVIQEHQFT